jgi:hypothetical protein
MNFKRDERLFNFLKAKSPILDDKNRSYLDPNIWLMANAKGLQGLVAELEGNATRAAGLLTAIDEEFERIKIQCRRLGKPEPTELPPDLERTAAECQARADLLALELAFVRKKLTEAEAREVVARSRQILPFGPRGDRKGGIIKSQSRSVPDTIIPVTVIDGQRVSYRDGLKFEKPYIDEPGSPYHGLDLKHYWPLVETWIKDHRECKPVDRGDLPARPPGKMVEMVSQLKGMVKGK